MAPLIVNASLGGGGGGVMCPALLVVLFWLAFLTCFSLLSVLFRGSLHVTACGSVFSHTIVNRW